MTTGTALSALDEACDLLGHIPEPIYDYLAWVLVDDPGGRAAVELRRLLTEVVG